MPVTTEAPKQLPVPRHAWLAARARNAMRRPVFIGAVSIGIFVSALVALGLAPQQARRAARTTAPPSGTRPDTTPIVAAIEHAKVRRHVADSALTDARRVVAVTPRPTSADTVSPAMMARRDSLAKSITDLGALLTRVEAAPLSASYRALGESPMLASDARVRALLDSLAEVDRDREGFGSSGGADPVFVALTSRATEIGRAIQAIAEQRRDTLRAAAGRITAPSTKQAVALRAAVDTTGWSAERDSAQASLTAADSELVQARNRVAEYDREAARARELATMNAPPLALLASALVFGIVFGFGAAFVGELKQPCVADEHETERLTGARVLATVRPRPPGPERGRRLADREAPPYFDPGADGYQLAYLHVARAGASRFMLTVTGDESAVAAVVAVNIGAIAADEARSTIVVDTDARTCPVAAALHIHAEPGIADILDKRAAWAEVVTPAVIGRSRVIDVIPSGVAFQGLRDDAVTTLFRQQIAWLTRHYEAIVIVATSEQAASGLPGVLPIPDTIVCARVGSTRLTALQASIDAIRAAGGNPLGVVLWDAEPPAFPTRENLASRVRVRAELSAVGGQRPAASGAAGSW
jgi:Mrp family chromosome partitioning ATPase